MTQQLRKTFGNKVGEAGFVNRLIRLDSELDRDAKRLGTPPIYVVTKDGRNYSHVRCFETKVSQRRMDNYAYLWFAVDGTDDVFLHLFLVEDNGCREIDLCPHYYAAMSHDVAPNKKPEPGYEYVDGNTENPPWAHISLPKHPTIREAVEAPECDLKMIREFSTTLKDRLLPSDQWDKAPAGFVEEARDRQKMNGYQDIGVGHDARIGWFTCILDKGKEDFISVERTDLLPVTGTPVKPMAVRVQ